MDPYLPSGLKSRGLISKAIGNRVALKFRIDNSALALIFGCIAFGSAVLNLFFMHSYAADHAAQLQAAEIRQASLLQSAESRLNTKYQEGEVETRMLEYYLLELDAKVIRAGIKPETESIASKLKTKREEKSP